MKSWPTCTCTRTSFLQLDDVEETVMERLVGLTEMVPERVWNFGGKGFWFSVWLVRRMAWVLGTSMALLALPPFIEQQRVEYEEMQNMQKKQVLVVNVPSCMCVIASPAPSQLMLGQGTPGPFPPSSPR